MYIILIMVVSTPPLQATLGHMVGIVLLVVALGVGHWLALYRNPDVLPTARMVFPTYWGRGFTPKLCSRVRGAAEK